MKQLLMLCLLFSVQLSLGEVKNDDSTFEVDPDIADQIFRSVTETHKTSESDGGLRIRVAGSVFNPSSLTLTNSYFVVDYEANSLSIPALQLALLRDVGYWKQVRFEAAVNLGYGYRESNFDLKTLDGSQRRSVVRLHWLPIGAGVLAAYPILRWLKLGIQSGLNLEYFYQSGTLDGLSQGFWIASAQVSPLVRLFDAASWGHIEVGLVLQQGLGTSQPLSGKTIYGGVSLKI